MDTPNLVLPYIAAAQAQKHVTHNEAIRALDAIVQLSVLDRDLTAPPAAPADGARYIVAAAATGAWTGHSGKVAAWQDGAWEIYAPREGWVAWIGDEDILVAWNGTAWVVAGGGGGGSVNPAPLVGVNTTADATNKLAVKSNAVLMSHDDVTPGTGDMRVVVNKSAAARTASFLFQDGFSGRAEIGLTGDDDFRFKVSADGTAFRDGILIDRSTGAVSLPNTALDAQPNLLINGDFQLNQRAFSGGSIAAGAYGFDRWKADTGGASVSVSGFVLTLASGSIVQFIEPALWGHASLASQVVTVSVESPSADMTVTVGSASGTITAGSGRRSVSLTTGAGDTGNVAVKLARAAAGSVTFGRVRLDLGPAAGVWRARPSVVEGVLAKRYFQRLGNGMSGGGTSFPNAVFTHAPFPVEMRATPTRSLNTTTVSVRSRGETTKTISSAVIADSAATARGFWVTISGTAGVGFGQDETVSLTGDVFNLDAEL